MRGALFMLSALAAAAVAYAGCPNACSGHGTCGAADACQCWDNFMGPDCSQRVCPFGLSFVDIPRGDLNHDGELNKGDDSNLDFSTEANRRTHFLTSPKGLVKVDWSNKLEYEYFPTNTGSGGYIPGASSANLGGLKAQDEEAHFYAECSAKGACDRDTGVCQCYEGYTGGACQRSTCPNGCSGHGTCLTLREVAAGSTLTTSTTGRNYRGVDYFKTYTVFDGVDAKFDYGLWDADKNQACVCDPSYFGPDCSLRECPRGNDPLTTEKFHCGNEECSAEIQAVYIRNRVGATDTDIRLRLGYTDIYSDPNTEIFSAEFTLSAGLDAADYADIIQNALESFPNSLLSGVTVSVNAVYDASAAAVSTDAYPQLIDLTDDGDVVELKLDFSNGPQGNVRGVALHQLGTATATDLEFGSVQADSAGAAAAVDGTNDIGSASIFTGQLTPVNGNTEYSPCSNRGLCDFSSGLCQCFKGFFGSACQLQNALAQ